MKYDSSMTQFHGDIVSAIKSMIHGDVDKVAELAAEGSPVPLRDYLREQHGRSFHGGNEFECMSSAFLVKFDHMINNLGDTKLQLSWSQVTGFIRKYPAEIFHREESYVKEASPGIEVLDLDVRTYNALKRAGISTIADAETQMEQLENIIPKKIEAVRDSLAKYKGIPLPGTWVEEDMLGDELTFDEITNMVGELIILDKSTDSQSCYKAVKVEEVFISSDENRCFRYFDGAKQRGTVSEVWFEKNRRKPERAWRIKTNTSDSSPAPAQPQEKPQDTSEEISAPAQSEAAAPAVFDYSELDADTAAKLENVTAEIFNVRKEYIFTMAKKVAYAHDLLANHYGGKFGAWCESIGISRDTGNNLVRVAELFGNSTEVEQKNLEQLNAKLLYEAARPSAPPVLVEQVKSGDITTHKEYIKLKNELERTKDDLRNVEMNFDEHKKLRHKLGEENVQLKIKANELEKQLEEAEEHNAVLSAEKEQAHRASKANLEKLNEERDRNAALERQLKELESRPVDVQIQQPDESTISLQAREMAQGLIRSAESAADKRVREIQQELSKKNKEVTELSEKLREAQASVLDAAFENNSGNSGNDLEQIKDFYEILHSRALSAIKDCFDFIGTDNISSEAVRAIKSRLRTFAEIVDDYINEMEEY